MWGEKTKKQEKYTQYSRQRGDAIKNTAVQIEAESREPTPGKQDVTAAEREAKLESNKGREKRQEPELRASFFPSPVFHLSMTLSR
jgi:hypothetical protein